MGNTSSNAHFNQYHLFGMSPEVRALHIAVMKNDTDTLEALISIGVSVDQPWLSVDNPSVKDGSTPLGQAVALNHEPVVKVLLGAAARVSQRDNFGFTPLHKAAFHGRKTLVPILVHAGADVNEVDKAGNTPMNICVQNGLIHSSDFIETVRALIRCGGSVNQANSEGKIPLHYAVLWGLHDIIKLLLKANACINYLDLERETPLFTCIKSIENTYNKLLGIMHVLPALKLMISSGCDTLNFALWLRNYKVLDRFPPVREHEDFVQWYRTSVPVELKQLCRVFIQNRISQHGDLEDIVLELPLPKILRTYLVRKPLCANVTDY